MREVFFGWLRSYRPDLMPRYEELYRRGAYVPKEERGRLAALVGGDNRAADSHPRGTRFGPSTPSGVVREGAAAALRARREAGRAPPAGRPPFPPPQEALF